MTPPYPFHVKPFPSIQFIPYQHKLSNMRQKKMVGDAYPTRLRNLGKKWIKILFALWSQGTTYDEALHIQNLKAKHVPWAMAL